jgi:tetratricopeptide (TPR) repeat protein
VATSEDDARKPSEPVSSELTPGARLAAQRAAKAAQKAAKKGTAPVVPSAVGERFSRFNELVEQNKRLILGSVLGVALVLLLATAWNTYSSAAARSAGKALAEAVSAVNANIRAERERLASGEGGDATVKKPDADRVLRGFSEAVETHPRTKASTWARLGEAKALYSSGKYAEAARAYAAVLEAAGDDAFIASRALEGLGISLEGEKKHKEALARFKEMAELAGGAFKPLADYHVARMYIAQGEKKRAAVKLNEVVTALQSASSGDARSRYRYVMVEASARLRELGYSPRRPGRSAARGTPAGTRARGGAARRPRRADEGKKPADSPQGEEE